MALVIIQELQMYESGCDAKKPSATGVFNNKLHGCSLVIFCLPIVVVQM